MRPEEQAPLDWGRPDEWLPPGRRAISPSMVGQFMRCGAQFYRRWYLGERIPPGVAAKRGTAVHAAAQENHRQKVTTFADLPLDHLQDVARDTFKRLVTDEETFFAPEEVSRKDTLLDEGLDHSTRLAKLYGEALAPRVWPVLVEQRLILKVPGLPVDLSGQIDVGANLQDGDGLVFWCPDIKTSAKSKSQGDADDSIQLTTYDVLAKHVLGKERVVLSLEGLTALKSGDKHVHLPTTRRPEDHELLFARYAGVLRAMRQQVFLPADPSNWWCSPKWCGFWTTCHFIPAYRR